MILPSLNRRRLLIGLAAASTAAATPALASTALPMPVENPDLIRLGDKLPSIAAEVDAATVAYTAARQLAEAHWPVAPDALTKSWRDSSTYERDVTGWTIVRPGEVDARSLWTTAELDPTIKDTRADIARKRRPGAVFYVRFYGRFNVDQARECLTDMERLRGLAAAYEADIEMVKAATGFTAEHARMKAAVAALLALTTELLPIPERTIAGVIIKAQALTAWDRAPKSERVFPAVIGNWSGQLAASILRISEAA